MKVTITQFRTLARDEDGNLIPLGKTRLGSEMRSTAGAFAALDDTCTMIRVATDTAIHMDSEGGTTTSADELIPANSVEYFAVHGGETLSIILA